MTTPTLVLFDYIGTVLVAVLAALARSWWCDDAGALPISPLARQIITTLTVAFWLSWWLSVLTALTPYGALLLLWLVVVSDIGGSALAAWLRALGTHARQQHAEGGRLAGHLETLHNDETPGDTPPT